MVEKYLYKNNHKKIFLPVLILLSSCASDSAIFNEYPVSFSKIEKFEVVRIFFIKDNIFTMNCDTSGNQLLMKFSKKEHKWKRSKYISKGCDFNSANLY